MDPDTLKLFKVSTDKALNLVVRLDAIITDVLERDALNGDDISKEINDIWAYLTYRGMLDEGLKVVKLEERLGGIAKTDPRYEPFLRLEARGGIPPDDHDLLLRLCGVVLEPSLDDCISIFGIKTGEVYLSTDDPSFRWIAYGWSKQKRSEERIMAVKINLSTLEYSRDVVSPFFLFSLRELRDNPDITKPQMIESFVRTMTQNFMTTRREDFMQGYHRVFRAFFDKTHRLPVIHFLRNLSPTTRQFWDGKKVVFVGMYFKHHLSCSSDIVVKLDGHLHRINEYNVERFSLVRMANSVLRINTRWCKIRSAVRFLWLHKRAVVTANHPTRKRDRGEFEIEDDV
jgi:hypothetical protein